MNQVCAHDLDRLYRVRQLFPHSDVDVLVLVPDGAATAAVETFIARCWDAGLPIGSSVRTHTECLAACAEESIETGVPVAIPPMP